MAPSIYVEDIFIQFVDLVDSDKITMQSQDLTASYSFNNHLLNGQAMTQSQGNLILKILDRYKNQAVRAGFDYGIYLDDPHWKMPFRVIDLTKKIWVESDDLGVAYICLKFPYQLKKQFDDEFTDGGQGYTTWDSERRIRKMILYKFNLIQVHEFVQKNGFEIDDTFLIALGEVEEIWQNQEDILPYSVVDADNVILYNSNPDTDEWWKSHCTGNYESDLLLAKSMGYPYSGKPFTIAEKIASSHENIFWIRDSVEFLNLCASVEGKVCVLLDRAGKTLDWLKDFELAMERSNIPRHQIKVCFRADKEQDPELNQWIKDHGFGGKVDEGKILIFNHKPAKWLFKDKENVKIIASNNLYPPSNTISRDWFNSHPCVVYLGDIKPTLPKEQKIVEL
jgi:hypothetical protein